MSDKWGQLEGLPVVAHSGVSPSPSPFACPLPTFIGFKANQKTTGAVACVRLQGAVINLSGTITVTGSGSGVRRSFPFGSDFTGLAATSSAPAADASR